MLYLFPQLLLVRTTRYKSPSQFYYGSGIVGRDVVFGLFARGDCRLLGTLLRNELQYQSRAGLAGTFRHTAPCGSSRS